VLSNNVNDQQQLFTLSVDELLKLTHSFSAQEVRLPTACPALSFQQSQKE